MRIDEIEIRNFRGFDEREWNFTFDPAINVVVGNNTSGKTALLHAVQIALGAYLKHLDLLKVANQQFRRNFSRSDIRTTYNLEKHEFVPIDKNPMIIANGTFTKNIENTDGAPILKETPIKWTRVLNYNTSDHGDMKAEAKELARVRRLDGVEGLAVLPLLLAFGTKRLVDNSQGGGSYRSKGVEIAVEKAYSDSLTEKVNLKSAFDWLFSLPNNIKKGLAFKESEDVFIDTIKAAIPAIKNIIINRDQHQFEAEYEVRGLHPDYRTYETMSDGFKSTIGMVAAMAYRCILLNGFLGYDAVKNTPGVVLIDEVDLFLHPRWQRHILHDLRNAFPNIQFIVTTHSPFIIQSVQNKNLIILDGVKEPIDPSNMGLEDIAEALMGMKTRLRSQKYQDKFALTTKYYELVKEGHSKDADIMRIKQELDKLEQEKDLIDDPGLAALLKSERQGL